jgi:hypothetical protein
MGRGRKRHQSSKKSIDESDPSYKGLEEEIATPTLRMSPRIVRPEEKDGVGRYPKVLRRVSGNLNIEGLQNANLFHIFK